MTKKAKIILGISVVLLLMLAVFFVNKPSASEAELLPQEVPDTTTAVKLDSAVAKNEDNIDSKDEIEEFPEAGNSINDFVVGPYEIAMEARGLLNEDELEDVALVLQEKQDSTELRPTIVLLKQKDGTYKRYATSWYAIGAAYINGDYQHYDEEDINIDSAGNLNIVTYGSGPVGNRDLKYRFVNNKLILSTMETYSMGAGGHTGMFYDFLKGFVKITEVNTMKDDMPATTTQEKLKTNKLHLFETTDPETI